MRIRLTALAFAASIVPAAASGGLDCSADDKSAKLEMHGGVTRGMGGPLFSFEGNIQIADKQVAEDLRRTSFEKEHVAQYWFDGDELRLGLYRERDAEKAHGYVEVTFKTKSEGEDGGFEGTYEVSVYDVVEGQSEAKQAKYSGKVSCWTE